MTTIDLGDVTGLDPAPPARPPDRRRILRGALAALAVAAVLAAGGSAHARHVPPVHTVWTVPMLDGDAAGYTADTAFVSRSRGGRTELTAYALTDGRTRWTSTLDEIGPVAPEPTADGLLLIRLDPVSVEEDGPDGSHSTYFYYRSTIALDVVTGAVRWRADGEAVLAENGTVLLSEHDRRGGLSRLTLIEGPAGRPVWTHPVAGVRTWAVVEGTGGRAAEVVTVGRPSSGTPTGRPTAPAGCPAGSPR
jgi:hypothetical protein